MLQNSPKHSFFAAWPYLEKIYRVSRVSEALLDFYDDIAKWGQERLSNSSKSQEILFNAKIEGRCSRNLFPYLASTIGKKSMASNENPD